METPQDAYARGVEAGRIAIRLDHHDDEIATTHRPPHLLTLRPSPWETS